MRKENKNLDLILALGLNIIFFLMYFVFFGFIHETNDDIAISYLVEGAYGKPSSFVVYQNVLWAKFLIGLYALVPGVKWYMVLMYLMIFLSFLSVTYVFLRIQGRKMGLVSSCAMLLFCGYNTYVMFQYSRVAPVVTAAGLVLLFYALEYVGAKIERNLCVFLGFLLVLWSSMIRFQMFALAVVLLAGALGLYLLRKFYHEDPKAWWRKILPYVAVFGILGMCSLGLYVADRVNYNGDQEWTYYQEFNEVRTELWDYGFPDYEENKAVYEAHGISENDFAYYMTWNMDEEFMTLERLHGIAAAKGEKSLDLFRFLSVFPINFLGYGVFVLFGVVSVAAVLLNRRNIYFVVFEFLGVMAFEAYFFYLNRYAIARVDVGMWMVAVITMLYAMSEDLKKFKVQSWKWSAVIIVLLTILFAADYYRTPIITDGVVGESKAFYEEVSEDKEHLYLIFLPNVPRIYYAYDFWEVSEPGVFSNVFNAYGWEFNVDAKKAVLEDYGITNIYRDSIDNEKVYFVVNPEYADVEQYIQENYNENVELLLVKEVEGVSIWRAATVGE